jgi:mRNA interferase MazF
VKRGDLYLLRAPAQDPRRRRAVVVVSRQVLIDSPHSTVVCAPIHSQHLGLLSEVVVGPDQGLKHPSSLRCDDLRLVAKTDLSHYLGHLSGAQVLLLDLALQHALGLFDPPDPEGASNDG